MGAEQSSNKNRGPSATAPKRTCYYELLGVERQAGDDDIKRAYRRKALELHPDRNLNDVENATRKFAEVQTAYEILSDAQERAWYDSHRDAILRGETDGSDVDHEQHYNVRLTTTEELYALMGKFSSAVPLNDSPDGFFAILEATFAQLATEEEAAQEWDHLTQASVHYPRFGSSKDDYEGVGKPFYAAWQNFSTQKSFSWKDKYRLSDAPDRRIRRLMEKENKKGRDDAIRDFNDAVRSFVAFVRKRDPRYVPNTQSEAERQKVLRDSAAAQAARSRVANQERLAASVVPDWVQSRGDKPEHEGEFSMSEEDSEVELLECIVCNKTFKSEKQYEAHEKSKKHLKTIQQMQRHMKRENRDLQLDPYGPSEKQAEDEVAPEGNDKDVAGIPDSAAASKKEIMSPPLPPIDLVISPVSPRSAGASDDDSGADEGDEGDEGDECDEYAPRATVADRLFDKASTAHEPPDGPFGAMTEVTDKTDELDLSEDSTQPQVKRLGKAKAKRQKKAAKQATEMARQGENKCGVCQSLFSSRTKLFTHIRELGHAELISSSKAKKGGKKQKR